ncbi:MAG: tRNA (N(6)-L-threonylcarbamoyladenosine(37)-C(2))-methylthiotransferase MtaB [Holdemanella sp.]|nr:tRNA (N(6)-L-threonylcarbamoyladenosine(37)-C(2))-methylthiotransferase MtaB [Holdemanella sp.]
MKFKIYTLGCKVNSYESQFYMEQLEKIGFTYTEDIADLYIINTCTVTNTAASKSRQKIHLAKKENPESIVVVIGCYAQCIDDKKREELHADIIIGAQYKSEIASIIQAYIQTNQKRDYVSSSSSFDTFEMMPIHQFESKLRAFLKVEDGCNQFCSYCTIPFARGRERSLDKDKVISIAGDLCDKGHKEIVLTGIHTGRYMSNGTNLTGLLKELIANTPEDVYYRISSIEITEVNDELIDLMKNNPRICHHLHIPIQSGCDATLKRMNRPYTVFEFKERLNHIRHEITDISISTDIIVGFVQESEEEFNQTYNTLLECQFSFLHVFPYSKRDGTKASLMKGEVEGSLKKKRVNKVLSLSKMLRIKDMERYKEIEVLIETHKGNIYTGYTNQYHPVEIQSDIPLEGRIKLSWNEIKNGTYCL